ncbi:hypothetical protein RJ641_003946 [Dillenia turbinata]|uniref:DNA-directed RNA polymerase subunit n=1 Tax=Dillenia turbinata TaxID=194707 RepID=A0AAN8Z9M9_9MAGN
MWTENSFLEFYETARDKDILICFVVRVQEDLNFLEHGGGNMFREDQMHWDVVVNARDRGKIGKVTWRAIVTLLLEDLLLNKASKDHGYFLAVTRLKSIRKMEVKEELGCMLFHLVFHCRVFKPVAGEILDGVVDKVCRYGAFLRCGPVRTAFLSARKMGGYSFVAGANPFFVNADFSKISIGVVVRFRVLAVRWKDVEREFQVLATLEGDFLGPVSLSGFDDLEL